MISLIRVQLSQWSDSIKVLVKCRMDLGLYVYILQLPRPLCFLCMPSLDYYKARSKLRSNWVLLVRVGIGGDIKNSDLHHQAIVQPSPIVPFWYVLSWSPKFNLFLYLPSEISCLAVADEDSHVLLVVCSVVNCPIFGGTRNKFQ